MGIWERIQGREQEPPIFKVGIIGQGPEAERLKKAYAAEEQTKVVAQAPIDAPDDVIRMRGLAAAEIVAPPDRRAQLARACIEAGLFTSVDAPLCASISETEEIARLAGSYNVGLRLRLHPLYYDPYIQAKKLLEKRAVGRVETLKMLVRRGRGTEIPAPFDPLDWIIGHELGFLALAEIFCGETAAVFSRMEPTTHHGHPTSSMLMWRHKAVNTLGFMQLDICPDLHVRTFTDPVHRHIELTGTDGVMFITRGEGQLMRMPVLMVRAKGTTTVHEMVKDEWADIYPAMAKETVAALSKGQTPLGRPDLCLAALRLALAGKKSREQAGETSVEEIS